MWTSLWGYTAYEQLATYTKLYQNCAHSPLLETYLCSLQRAWFVLISNFMQINKTILQDNWNHDQAHYIVHSLLVECYGWMDGWMEVWPGKGWEPRKQWVGQQSPGGWMIWAKSCLLGFFKFWPGPCHRASPGSMWGTVAYLNKWTSGLKADEQNLEECAWCTHAQPCTRWSEGGMSEWLLKKWTNLALWSHDGH